MRTKKMKEGMPYALGLALILLNLGLASYFIYAITNNKVWADTAEEVELGGRRYKLFSFEFLFMSPFSGSTGRGWQCSGSSA